MARSFEIRLHRAGLRLHRSDPSGYRWEHGLNATFQALVEEYRRELVGEKILSRVRILAEGLLRARDPRVYARGAHDYRDALDDISHDFILDVLIQERQIDYIMNVSEGTSDVDRLLARHLRRYLARTRERTVVDNLLDRSVDVLRSSPFRVVAGSGPGERFGRADTEYGDMQISDEAVRRAVALARSVPTDLSKASDRAPRVYDHRSLVAVIQVLLKEVAAPISRGDLDRFFRQLLTAWLPGLLEEIEEYRPQRDVLSPEEEAIANDAASRMIVAMNDEEKTIFVFKHANLPDRELAARLGLSRQSTAPRKAALFERLAAELSSFGERMRLEIIAIMATALTMEGQESA